MERRREFFLEHELNRERQRWLRRLRRFAEAEPGWEIKGGCWQCVCCSFEHPNFVAVVVLDGGSSVEAKDGVRGPKVPRLSGRSWMRTRVSEG